MKLGKKSLSLLLAMMMIITSISVSFTSLAATGAIETLTTAINDHYTGLEDAIDSGDSRLVPTSSSGIGAWAVEQDTYDSGWYYVAKAYTDAAKSLIGTYTSYYTLNQAIINEVTADDNSYATLYDYLYEDVLEYFSFGATSSSDVTTSITLSIATSFDLLYWDDIDGIDEDHTYYEGTMSVTYSSSKISAIGFVSSELSDPFASDGWSITMVKDALESTVTNAVTWETLDFDDMTSTEIFETLVTGTTSVSQVLNSFDLLVYLTAYEPEEVWDHYVADAVDMTYAELVEWQDDGVTALINEAYADEIQSKFFTQLDFVSVYSNYSGSQTLALYNNIMAEYTYIETLTNYTYEKFLTDVAPLFDSYSAYGGGGMDFWDYVVDYTADVKKAVAQHYTSEYIEDFMELVNREVPSYDVSDEEAAAAWQGSDEEAEAEKFVADATTMLTNFETYVLDYCEGDTTVDKFYTVLEVFVDIDGTQTTITYANYEALVTKLSTYNLFIDGSSEYETKAYLDASMDTWFLDGEHYETLVSRMNEFETAYDKAVALETSDPELYAQIYANGTTEYQTYLNNIKTAIYERIGMQADSVTAYYSQGDNGAKFYNYEAIIASYEAAEVKTAAALSSVVGLGAGGLVSSGMFETEAEASAYIATYTSKLTNISTYYNEAISYKTNLTSAISSVRTNGSFILGDFVTGYSGYKWETLVGKVSTDEILAFIQNIVVTDESGVNITDVESAMAQVVEELDALLVSEDVGSLLGTFLSSTDEETGEVTTGLGTWNYDYESFDGTEIYAYAGEEITTLTEYLVNMILTFLYSGNLQTSIMTLIYPMLADAINGLDTIDVYDIWISELYIYPSKGLTEVLATLLPSLPHHFYLVDTSEGHMIPWANFFRDAERSEYTWYGNAVYTEIASSFNVGYTSPGNTIDGIADYAGRLSSWDDVDTSTWDWNITDQDSFYDALTASLCGLLTPISSFLVGDDFNGSTKVSVLGDWEIAATLSLDGMSLYDELFVVIYNMLGITDFPTEAEVEAACTLSGSSSGYIQFPVNNGVDMLEVLLEPIFDWMFNDLFVSPVDTIINMLPNLLVALEYNQILPIFEDLLVDISIEIVWLSIDIDITTLDVGSIITDLVDGMGIDLTNGVQGLIDSLFAVTLTTTNPGEDSGLTVTDEDGVVSAVELHVGDRANTSTCYYATNCGILASTLYSLAGDEYIEWVFGYGLSSTSSSNGKVSTDYELPLQLPVSTMIASGSVETIWVDGCQSDFNVYQIDAEPGLLILVLFRWLFNDGGLDSLVPLVEPVLNSMLGTEDTDTDDDSESILDMILRIVDTQADTLMAILITLFNVYYPDYFSYYDAVEEETFVYTTTDVDGNVTTESYLNDDGSSKFDLGSILTESLAAIEDSDLEGVDKASAAVESLDTIIDEAVPIILSLFADELDVIGISGLTELLASGELDSLESIVMEGFITNDVISMLFELLFAEGEAVYDDEGNAVLNDYGVQEYEDSLFGGLLGSDTVAMILNIAAEIGFDLTPYGYYISTDTGSTGENEALHEWLGLETIKATGISSNSSEAQIAAAIANLTWADIGMSTLPDDFEWFDEGDTYDERFENFVALLCDLLDSLNPVFSLLLSGEDLTFMDTLTIRGGEGYSTAIIPLFDALGICLDSTYISTADEGVTATQAQFNEYIYGSATPTVEDGERFYTMKESIIEVVLMGLKDFLMGSNGEDGLLDAPISFIFEILPNIAYALCLYDEYDEDGNLVYDADGSVSQTNNVVVIVENLAAPILKLLEVVDPILSRLISIDILEYIDELLDFENTLNTMISQMLDTDWSSLSAEEQARQSESYQAITVLDFGTLAAYGSTSANVDAQTSRYTEDGDTTFTYFEADKGQVLITLFRELLSDDMIDLIASLATELINSDEITDSEIATSENNIILIIQGIVERINAWDSGNEDDGAVGVDFLIGIIIQLLTEYESDEGTPFYYQLLNDFEGAYNDMILTDAWEKYGVEHDGYDWDSDAAVEAELTLESVEDTVEGFDYVLSVAVPDIIEILVDNGVFDLGIDLSTEADTNTIWQYVSALVNDNVFTDDTVNWLISMLVDLLSGLGDDVDMYLEIVKAVGFDLTPEAFIYNSDGSNSELYSYFTYGYESVTQNADGTVSATIDGESADFSWAQIYDNHTQKTWEVDEDGNVVLDSSNAPTYATDEDGEYIYETMPSQYTQLMSGGKYVYTYTDADGVEQEFTSAYANLPNWVIDGESVTLEVVRDTESDPLWSWGLDVLEYDTIADTFSARKTQIFDIIWSVLAPLSDLIGFMFAGNDLQLLDESLFIAGNDGYVNVVLPLFRAFGFDTLLEYLNTTLLADVLSEEALQTYGYSDSVLESLTLLGHINYGRAEDDQLADHVMTEEEYLALAYDEAGNFDADGMGEIVYEIANYVVTFLEVLTTYPVTTLTTALPTVAYFLYSDGLTTILENLLIPVTTITNQLQQIIALDVEGMVGGLIDMLGTGSWSTLQASLQQYYEVDEDGNLTFVEFEEISLTDILFELATSFTFDLSAIISTDDETDDGMYSLAVFLDKDAELEAKAALAADVDGTGEETANAIRAAALKDFIKSVVALGDPVSSYDDLDSSLEEYADYVYISDSGVVTISSAEVLMFLIEFIFSNTALEEILGNLLGIDITDENYAEQEVELLDEIITNVFTNPEALVGLIVDLFTGYSIAGQDSIVLIEIVSEEHYNFYEDLGYASEDEIDEDSTASEISRIKTSIAIESLDDIAGSVLNLLKSNLLAEDGMFGDLGLEDTDEVTLSVMVEALIASYVANDEMLNSLVSMLVSALGSDESLTTIINVVVDVLKSAGYDLSPEAFSTVTVADETSDTILSQIIGEAETWGDIAAENTQYVYTTADGTLVYSDTAGSTVIDGVAVTPVYETTTDEDGNETATTVQATELHIEADWGFDSLDDNETIIDHFIDVAWEILEPLSPILELFLTGQNLTIYDTISVTGMQGYEGVILPLFEAFGAGYILYSDTYEQYDTYEKFYDAVYGTDETDGDKSLLLTVIFEMLFDFVYSLCDAPITTLTTALPILALYLESDAIDTMLENILSPVTYFADKLSSIYDIDIVGLIKDLLYGLIDTSNEANEVDSDSTEVEDQVGGVALVSAYALDIVEDAADGSDDEIDVDAALADIFGTSAASEESDDMTLLEIIWEILDGVYISGVAITDILPETMFMDLASCVWRDGSTVFTRVDGVDENGDEVYSLLGETNTTGSNVVDKESVFLNIFEWIVFTDGVKDLLADLLGMDLSLEDLSEDDANYIIIVLLYSIFDDAEPLEKLVVELLSFYEVEYAPERVSADIDDYEALNSEEEYDGIDYETIGIDETELDDLTSQLDSLISIAVPMLTTLIPEGTLGDIELHGDTTEEVLGNIVIDMLLTDTVDEDGNVTSTALLTSGIEMLIELIATNDTVSMILPLVDELVGIDVELANFMSTTPALAEYFAGCETWADAYEMFYDEEAGTVVLTDVNGFGIESFSDVMDFVAGLIAPFESILTMLLLGEDIVILEGIEIVAGDGYDRFLIPLFEIFDMEIMSKDEMIEAIENSEIDGAFSTALIGYIEDLLVTFLTSPIETIVDFIPQLAFYAYSGGLAQGLEQFLAPVITAIDKIVDIVAKEVVVNDTSYVAFDVYDFVTSWINETTLEPVGLDQVDDIYGLIETLVTVDGLETVLDYWITEVGEKLDIEIDLGFEMMGLFETILNSCGYVTEVETVREYGAVQSNSGANIVVGFESSSADVLIGVLCDLLLTDEFLPALLSIFYIELDDTFQTVISAVTGENRYAIIQILLTYFNEYDVETLDLENLSFEKIEYAYSTYIEDTVLSQRKLRRSLLKLDSVLVTSIPTVIEYFQENETVATILESIGGYSGQSLEDLVNDFLEVYLMNDDSINEVTSMVTGLLDGDTLDTILSIVDNIVGIDLTPSGMSEAASNGGIVQSYFEAAAAYNSVEVDDLTWSLMNVYVADNSFEWGFDECETTEEKRELFIELVVDFSATLSVVIEFLLCGEDIVLIGNDSNETALTLKGNDGYDNVAVYIFEALSLDTFALEQGIVLDTSCDNAQDAMENIINALFVFIDNITTAPVETLLTALPTLAYFIASDGIEVLFTNMLSPVLALLDVVYPVAGPLIEEFLSPYIEQYVGDYLPSSIGTEKTDSETGETYMVYTIDELFSIAGDDGSDLVSIINNLINSLLFTDETGNETEIFELLPSDFFSSYAQHTITINSSSLTSTWYYYVELAGIISKVLDDDYDSSMGEVVDKKYVVDSYTVDIADSLIYILDTVLSDSVISLLADLLGLDMDDESNMISGILTAVIDGDYSALVLADIIVNFFEGYDIEYIPMTGVYVDTDKDYSITVEQEAQLEEVPESLDTVLNNALEILVPMADELLASLNVESDIVDTILGAIGEDSTTLSAILDDILNSMVFTDEIMTMLIDLVVPLLGNDIVDIVALVTDVAGYSIMPQDFLSSMESYLAEFQADDSMYETTEVAQNTYDIIAEIIGENETWVDVAANMEVLEDGEVYDFGITDSASFIEAIYVFISPLSGLLPFILQGATLGIFDYSADAYIPIDDDTEDPDTQVENAVGNGYLVITGVDLYEQAFLPLFEVLGIYTGTDDNWNETTQTGIMSSAEFAELDNTQEILVYLSDIIFDLIDEFAGSPFQWLSTNLASIVYFIGSDGVYEMVTSILQVVNTILEFTDPLFTGEELRLDLSMVSLDELLPMLNDLLGDIGIEITQDLLLELAGNMGDFYVYDSLRTSAVSAIKDENGRYVKADGELYLDDNEEAITDYDVLVAKYGDELSYKVSRITGEAEYFLIGLIDTVLGDDILGALTSSLELEGVLETILTNLEDPDAMLNIVEVIIMLFNDYINQYEIIEDSATTLAKTLIDYDELGITQEETLAAISTIDDLLGTVLGLIGLGSIEDLMNEYLYSDDTINTVLALVLDLLAGLDTETWDLIEMIMEYASLGLGVELEFSPAAYATGDGKLAELFTDCETWADASAKLESFDWGFASAETTADKTDILVSIVCDVLAPLDEILAVFLAGGVYYNPTTGEWSTDETPDSISLLGEISIMGGSGYNYVIIPILEAFGITNVITQAQYNTLIADGESPLEYILETLLGYITENVDAPITFVMSIISNLMYFISKDGLTTTINNLVAPVSQYLYAVQDILPISINLDLEALFEEGGEFFSFLIGDDVAANGASVGLNIDLDGDTLESLVATLLATYVPDLEIDLDFTKLASSMAEVDENGSIILTPSAVDPNWDESVGEVGNNITGNAADTLIVIFQTFLTTENIEAILDMVGLDITGLDESLQEIIQSIIDDPTSLIKLVVEILNMDFDFVTQDMIFYFLGEEDYDYRDDDSWKLSVTSAINKLDNMIDNVIPEVLEMLATGDAPIALVVSIYEELGEDATLESVIDYVLEVYVSNDDMVNTIMNTFVGIIAGLDPSLIDTIASVVNTLFETEIELSLEASDFAVGDLADFIDAVTPSDEEVGVTWADVVAHYSDEDGNLAIDYDWGVTDITGLIDLVCDLLTPFESVLYLLLVDSDFGYELYTNALAPLALGLGIDIDTSVDTGVEAVEEMVDGIIDLVYDLADSPITVILETITNLAFFIANDGVTIVISNILAPVDEILEVVDSFFETSDGGIDSIIESFIGMSIDDIKNIAGNGGENLVDLVNEMISSLLFTSDGEETTVIELLPSDFFTAFSQYAIDVSGSPELNEVVTSWSVDTTDALMYILMTVFSSDLLDAICDLLALEDGSTFSDIIKALAGQEDQLVDIILMLINDYDVSYSKISQESITKIPVDSTDAETILGSIDGLIDTLLEVLGIDSLAGLLDGLVADLGLTDMVIELLVPVLAGLDLDDILGIVASMTNIDISLDPQTFVNENGYSSLSAYIADATTWQEVLDAHATTITAEDGSVSYEFDDFDFEIDSIQDIADFFVDLLAPFDFVIEILLCGDQIIAFEDESGEGNDIRINGGYGYNYAIIPLLEAFGIDALSQEEYEAYSEENGSYVKYILDEIINLVEEICENPVDELLSRLANLFYFIGSDGINTVVSNLIAPINAIIEEVDDALPIAININIANLGIEGEDILELYFGEAHPGLDAGISVDVSGESIDSLVNSLLEGLEIAGSSLALSIDLDWNTIAAMMALEISEGDASGLLVKTASAQVYDLGGLKDSAIANYVNIQGDSADTLATLIDVIFSTENCTAISEFIIGLLPDTLDEETTEMITSIINTPNAINELISAIILIISGGYDLTAETLTYYYLGEIEVATDDGLDDAIVSLDNVIQNAIPILADLVPSLLEMEDGSILDMIFDALAASENDIYDALMSMLNEEIFTADMMQTITSLLIETISGFLSEDLVSTLNDLLGMDLSPTGYAAATGNDELIAYVANCTTWADVVDKNTDADGVLAAVFTNIASQDDFIDALLDLLVPLNGILGFILTGDSLGENFEGLNYYTDVIKYLTEALGFAQFDIEFVEDTDGTMTATEALGYTIDYIFAFVEVLCDAPVSTIVTLLGNLGFFIASEGLDVFLSNLLSPVEMLIDTLSEVVSVYQLDVLLEGFIGFTYTEIIEIGMNKGENLVEFINSFLGSIEITDADGKVVYTMSALDEDFFTDLAKACVKVETGTQVGAEITDWDIDNADALMFILQSVLEQEFVSVLCQALGLDTTSGIGEVIDALANKETDVANVFISLFNTYTVEYTVYEQAEITAISNDYSNEEIDAEFEYALSVIDELIPTILELVGLEAESLSDLLYSMIVTDDIANTLVSLVVELLAGLPSDTIDMVLDIVNDATNITLDINPQAFTTDTFDSALDEYIGSATTWAEVWANNSTEIDGETVAVDFAFGIDEIDDFVNLICDMLLPLDAILELLLSGESITLLDEVTIIGGYGYNYAVIPLLEALGVSDVATQEEYEQTVEQTGSSVYCIIDTLIGRVDELLESPIESIASMLSNLFYMLGNDTLETLVANLVAPVNELIKLIDPIFPIAIEINMIGLVDEDTEILGIYLGEMHTGIDAGISLAMDSFDLTYIINTFIGGIAIGDVLLELEIDLDWLELAAMSAQTDENGDIIFTDSAMTVIDGTIYDSTDVYQNIEGSSSRALIALLTTILTEENLNEILGLLGFEDGFGDPFDEIIDQIISNPGVFIELINTLVTGVKVEYIPVQNREIYAIGYNWSNYTTFSEANATTAANELDGIVEYIVSEAGLGSLESWLTGMVVTDDIANTLASAIYGIFANDTAEMIFDMIKDMGGDIDLDLTAQGYYEKLADFSTNTELLSIFSTALEAEDAGWADVAAAFGDGIDWGLDGGTLYDFVDVLVEIFTPFASVLEILLIGDDLVLELFDVASIPGGDGYDYAIIPLLEAFGISADALMSAQEYEAAYASDPTVLLSAILEPIVDFAIELLNAPVDTLTSILPNFAYFIANEGLYLTVRNLLAPIYGIIEVFEDELDIEISEMLDINFILQNIEIAIELWGESYNIYLPEIDFFDLAELCAEEIIEVDTARSYDASSYISATDPFEVKDEANKTTQTYIVADQAATLAYVLTFAISALGVDGNISTITDLLARILVLDESAKATLEYGLTRIITLAGDYDIPDIIVSALFEALGVGIVVEGALRGDFNKIQEIYELIFASIAESTTSSYGSIAKVMEDLTGIWNDNVGDLEDYEDALDDATESLNWFQKIIAAIKEFFQNLFGITAS